MSPVWPGGISVATEDILANIPMDAFQSLWYAHKSFADRHVAASSCF
jgi:hypothetical protein